METSRITTGWKPAGTTSFRLASGKLLNLWGTNLQNPSKRVCQCIIPDKGKVFVQVDQAGAEALIVAYLCRHGKLRDLFLNGIKSHIYVAMHLFKDYWDEQLGMPSGYVGEVFCKAAINEIKQISEWPKLQKLIKDHDTYYFIGKKTCHSSNYGIAGSKFRLGVLKDSGGRVALSFTEATLFLDTYHAIFPEIREWHLAVEKQVKKTKKLYNLFGFPREFVFYILTDSILRDAYSFVPQSTVGTLTNIAYVEMFNYIEEHKKPWDLLNNKHDSYLVQCPEEDAKEVAKQMQFFIEKEFKGYDGTTFRMRSEAAVGKNWGKYHETKNPLGMKEL